MRPPPAPPAALGEDIANAENNDPNLPAMMLCTRLAGRAIIRVVGRCNEAQENNNLGTRVHSVVKRFRTINNFLCHAL